MRGPTFGLAILDVGEAVVADFDDVISFTAPG
jgi:hypothetical protein